ncbi:MAG: helix-turn-helix transcriptional regulator [Streptosporangiaceae bacterium]
MNQHEVSRPWFWLRGKAGAGIALAEVRREAGLTQAQLAAQVGIERTTILNMEAGRNTTINRFVDIINRLGYDLIAVPRGARVSVTVDGEDGAE